MSVGIDNNKSPLGKDLILFSILFGKEILPVFLHCLDFSKSK